MGKWLDVVSLYYATLDVQWKPAWDYWEESLSPTIFGELAPYGLMFAADALGPKGRKHFPMLSRVRAGSDAYVDESLWLRPAEVVVLLEEFRRLRKLCHEQEFIEGVA